MVMVIVMRGRIWRPCGGIDLDPFGFSSFSSLVFSSLSGGGIRQSLSAS